MTLSGRGLEAGRCQGKYQKLLLPLLGGKLSIQVGRQSSKGVIWERLKDLVCPFVQVGDWHYEVASSAMFTCLGQ
jgi:hypothetical protein